MAPTILNLLDQCIPIQDAILQHLEIRDVISLAKSTKTLKDLVKVVEKTQFNINRALDPFFDVNEFRSLQAQHNVFITSYFAYAFLSRMPTTPPAMDGVDYLDSLCVQSGEHATALDRFLLGAGYRENERDDKAVNWTIIDYLRDDDNEIRVYVTTRCPIVSVLEESYTHLTCFITWNKAYSVHAYTTHIMKQSYLQLHIEDVKHDISNPDKQTVAIRPCSLADYAPGTVPQNSKMRLSGRRRIGDARSWIIPLNTNDIAPSSCPDEVIESAEFTISVEPDTFGHYNIKHEVVRSPALKYEYVISEIGDPDEQKRFDDLAILGIYKLAKKHQPPNMRYVFNTRIHGRWREANMEAIEGWEPPKNVGWVYHDDEMIAMMKTRRPKKSREEVIDEDE